MAILVYLVGAMVAAVSVSGAPAKTATHVRLADVSASDYHWTVTHWTSTCGDQTDSNCTFAFNVTGPDLTGSNPVPSLSAYCEGYGIGTPYSLCELYNKTTNRRQVVAKLDTPSSTNKPTYAHVDVSYRFDDLNNPATAWWNYTAFAAVPYTFAGNFTLIPTQIGAVA